jgi:hypothetical protein
MLSLLRRKNIMNSSFTNFTRQYKTCPEDDNTFSTTLKVNFFTFLFTGSVTGTLSSLIRSSHEELKNEIQELKKEINKLNKKN